MKNQKVLGNTKPKPNAIKSRGWALTINNWTQEEYDTLTHLFSTAKQWIIGKEVGDEKGTPHLQAYGYWKNALSFETIKKAAPRAHIEAAKGRPDQNEIYCRKEGDYTGAGFPAPLKYISELREWQGNLCIRLDKDPDDRKITWIVDLAGGKGKTALCRYLCIKRGAILLGGKAADMKYAIAELEEIPNIILMNLTRSQEDYVSYQGIEEIKDGIFFTTKYKSGMKIYNPPHVVVFSNWEPKTEKLSADRWNIIHLE